MKCAHCDLDTNLFAENSKGQRQACCLDCFVSRCGELYCGLVDTDRKFDINTYVSVTTSNWKAEGQ